MNLGDYVQKHHRVFFYGSWLLLNLIQSSATELFDDEAYYWVYSNFMDWGYFDHPPMIALLIKIGYSIFPNEFGVRLLAAIMSTAALRIIENLLTEKDSPLFYAIALSMAVLQIGGILAVPDIPLLFFTTLFFWAYKHFLQRSTLVNAILLGLCMALMMYSKYHGALLILLTLASNPKLLKHYQAWLAVFISILLFFPHLYWQYQHGFPSVQYHLLERNATSYNPSFTLEYIGSQLLLAGPLTGIILVWAILRHKPVNDIERALKFSTIGFYIFFLLSTFKGRVEGNWTFPAFIGLMALGHQYILHHEKLKNWIYRLGSFTIVAVLIMRFYMLEDILPLVGFKNDEFRLNRVWVRAIREKSGGLPVFFVDSYQRASKYWFYTGEHSHSLNTVDYRRNNYNYWKLEDSLQNQRTYAVYQGKHEDYFTDSIMTRKGPYLGRIIDSYYSFSRIRISADSKIIATANQPVSVKIKILSDSASLLQMQNATNKNLKIWVAVYLNNKDEPIIVPTDINPGHLKSIEETLTTTFKLNIKPGNYVARFGITSCIDDWPSLNSAAVKIRVEGD